MLPPLILEIRAQANQLFSTVTKEVPAAVDGMATKTEASQARMQAAFEKTAVIGKGLAIGVAAAGIAVGIETTKMAADFQSKMTLLVTAGGESQKNMKLVSDGVLSLAAATGTSIDQLAEGMYTVEKSGNRGAAGLLILKAAAQGAKAENVDLGIATNALTSVMMSYHEKASDAVKVQNEMIAGSGLAKTTMQEYAGSLSAVLPVASAAGIGFDQVAGAIATLTQHGTSAQESTQELANTIRGLQAPNMVASKAMQQLGINVTDVSQNLGKRGLTGTIDLITEAIGKNMGPSGLVMVDTFKKSQSASADAQIELAKLPASLQKVAREYLAGTITQHDWTHALKTQGVEHRQLASNFALTVKQSRGFNDLLKSGSPAATTFAGTLNKVMGGATGMNTALMLGGENMAYFKKATEEVGKAGEHTGKNISTWAKTQSNLKVQMAQAGEGIAVLGVRIGTVLIPYVSKAVQAFIQFGDFLGKNPALVRNVGIALGIVAGIFVTAYVAQKAYHAAMVIGQGVMIAYNVVAGILGVTTKASTAASYGQAGATYASAAAQRAYAIGAGISTAATKVGAAAVLIWSGVQRGAMEVQKAFTVLQYLAKASTLEYVGAMIVQKAALIGGAVATGVMTAAQWAFNLAADANPIGLVILAIAALIAIIILVVTHWKEITSFLSGAWRNLGIGFQIIGNAIMKWWNGFWDGIIRFATDVFRNYIGFIATVWNSVLGFFQGAGRNISNWWGTFWSGLVSLASGIFKGGFNFVTSILNGIIDGVNGLTAGINTVGGAIGVKLTIGKMPHLPSFDVGGQVPGAPGQASLAIVHGAEYMLSQGMLAGTQPISPAVRQAVASNPSSGGSGASTVGGTSNTVTVYVKTDASPARIAAAASWELRRRG
jgi:hypothetical protein